MGVTMDQILTDSRGWQGSTGEVADDTRSGGVPPSFG